MKFYSSIFPCCLFFLLLSAPSFAKPSYSFGDGPRRCKSNNDCAMIIVSCHNCDWADSVNKESLKASEEIVKNYCDNWRKNPGREPDCKTVDKVKKRDLVCNNGICECQTTFAPSKPLRTK